MPFLRHSHSPCSAHSSPVMIYKYKCNNRIPIPCERLRIPEANFTVPFDAAYSLCFLRAAQNA